MTWFLALLALLAGIAGLALGEADDSPGLQLIGAVLVLTAVVAVVRHVRRGRHV
ncbi:hypothetical protein MRU69_10485 [Kocuria flava]|uniref:hypothetical protein n=1 Tax=Kocuria flava TaxID=446860 RepID=UPI001FF32FEB|nr:hypothetical protein [Kocuria flava]MCJ8505281.1 hypothetical protein [Kocuria flava]